MEPALFSTAGVKIPRIIYGTAWKKSDTEVLVRAALRVGFRGLDTACQPKHYDEAAVGKAVQAFLRDDCAGHPVSTRGDLYLQTKFTPVSGHDPSRIPYDPRATLPQQVEQSWEVSRRNLHTDCLDCLLLHSPLGTSMQTMETWRAMESLVERGGVRQLGISNCYRLELLETLCATARIRPAVVQNRFYAETGYDREIRAFCRDQRIVYQSFWTLTANPQLLASATLMQVAARHGRTPAQILFRYLSEIDVVPLTGTRREAHMRQDLEILAFELSAPERGAIDALLSLAPRPASA
jgi:diketogulonate reductase-like aldo/keto reductase